MAKRKAAGSKRKARKTSGRLSAAKKSAARKKTAAKRARSGARKAVARRPARKTASSRTSRKRPARKATAGRAHARKVPALDRARRTVQGDDIVPTPPSSLDLDRTASAARSGRRQMIERLNEHHETSPALTAGDVDADWESAAAVGDEAPGGDNPTPDQDIVDDIGKAVGVQYDDNEELKGEAKITKRDKHRWELDPASSEDYEDR